MEKIFNANNNKKKIVAILKSDKMDLCENCYKGPSHILHINKRINSSRRYNNYKHTCTKQQNPKTYEANICRFQRRKRQFYNNSWSFQYHNFNNGQNIQTEGNTRLEQLYKFTRHVQNTSPNKSRIYILLKCTCNSSGHTLSHKTNLNKLRKIEVIQNALFDYCEMVSITIFQKKQYKRPINT